jgi:tetraprenyl-beta-curcumene synthase
MEYSTIRASGTHGPHGFLREAGALLLVGPVYWLRLQPLARRELGRWRRRASTIPDASLRACALGKLSEEALNPEAAALFAVLAPRSRRCQVAAFIVAYQVLYDYLDALNELPGWSDLRTGLQLHRALTDAFDPGSELRDIYQHDSHGGDGGYVEALVGECRRALGALPQATSRLLACASRRCAEAQSHNHAFLSGGDPSLVEWSRAQASPGTPYEWWELAAGGISCLAVHALVACAAHAESSTAQLSCVERAYFPSVCALSALLDSLADFYEDARTENHSFVAHYADPGRAAGRLVAIAAEASTLLETLPNAARHKIIMVGVCSYYLSCGSVLSGFPVIARRELLEHLGWLGGPMLGAMRARRWLQHPRVLPRALGPSCALAARDAGERRKRAGLARRARAAWLPRSSRVAREPGGWRA